MSGFLDAHQLCGNTTCLPSLPSRHCVASRLVTEVQSLYDGQVFGDAKAGLEDPSSTNVHENVLQQFENLLVCHVFTVLLGSYIHKFGKNALSQKLEHNVC